jgi:hypothetical protein
MRELRHGGEAHERQAAGQPEFADVGAEGEGLAVDFEIDLTVERGDGVLLRRRRAEGCMSCDPQLIRRNRPVTCPKRALHRFDNVEVINILWGRQSTGIGVIGSLNPGGITA